MMVFLMQSTVPSATPKQISRSVNPNHLKTGKLVNNFRPCGRFWPIKVLFPERNDTGAFIVPALDARAQVLEDRRNSVGKPVFKLSPF